MNKTKKILLYISYIIAALIFFLYILFPSDTVKTYIEHQLSGIHPDVSISINTISPAFPPGVRLNNVSFYYIRSLLLDAETIKIVPGFLSLLSSKKAFSFKGVAGDGIIKGRGNIGDNAGHIKIDADLTGIQLKDIPAVQIPAGSNKEIYKISGILDGKVTYSNNKGSDRIMEATLGISDCNIKFNKPVFNHGTFTFNKIEADLTTVNKRLQLKSCIIEGHQINANISGSAVVKKSFGSSVLNLKGKIELKPFFFESMKENLLASLFPEKMSGSRSFSFKVGGTIDHPEYTVK
ncbi:MAG: type II secretion system protein GspN [Thermodesulfobacteriota bacterium]|nr:type II secretion system protein GspN [Thermodesulfobacteriota bacterium]